jgi:pimeloyl-ACP methyl ester carboxylesterase
MYIDLPGVRLWVVDSGGAGVPIMLLHANTGTSRSWENQITAFSRAGYRAIAFDRRGWGKSTADPGTGPQPGTIADDLEAAAGHFALDSFHLVAIAGGAFAALDYAAWRPQRLRSLVVAASTGQLADEEIKEFVARIEIPGLRKLPAVYREVSASYRGSNPEGTKCWMAIDEQARAPGSELQPMRTPNRFAKLATISTPALILAAGADLLAPPALMRIWAAHVKGHEWAVIGDAGHALAWEQPDIFNRMVLEFLSRH